MKTLLLPCAGRSSRFPGTKPKWLLTHPDGKIMVQKAIEGLDLSAFDQIVITLVKEHDEKYDAQLVLSQIFEKSPIPVKICVLDDFTKSASETVYLSIKKMNIEGSFVIKDSDNFVHVPTPYVGKNAIVGYDLHTHPNITNVPGKSFLIVDNQNIIQDIVEKKVVSNIICLGIYAFENAADFLKAYEEIQETDIKGEVYVSHVISYMLTKPNIIFEAAYADDYQDWGTIKEWRETQDKYKSYFVDFDGVLMKNSGRYGAVRWDNNNEVLQDNMDALRDLYESGAQIIITTSRPEIYREKIDALLKENGITAHGFIMNLNHAGRVLINDFAPTNPYPSCEAVSFPRNGKLKDYL